MLLFLKNKLPLLLFELLQSMPYTFADLRALSAYDAHLVFCQRFLDKLNTRIVHTGLIKT